MRKLCRRPKMESRQCEPAGASERRTEASPRLALFRVAPHPRPAVVLSADHWPDDVRFSAIEPQFVCVGGGNRGAEVRPDFDSGTPPQFASSRRVIAQLRLLHKRAASAGQRLLRRQGALSGHRSSEAIRQITTCSRLPNAARNLISGPCVWRRALPGDRRQAGPRWARLDPRSEARRLPDAGHSEGQSRAPAIPQWHRLDQVLSLDHRGRLKEPTEALRR